MLLRPVVSRVNGIKIRAVIFKCIEAEVFEKPDIYKTVQETYIL
jgi:hypothetical protein